MIIEHHFNMKTLLLTGSTGYLGSYLKSFYENQGWLVLTLGRSSCCDYFLDFSGFEKLTENLESKKIDKIIHTAAVNEVDIDSDLEKAYKINVTLTRLLVELCSTADIREFVYISTFHVYGVDRGVVNEATNCVPKNDYGLTHYLSEKIVRFAALNKKIKCLIVRPTNIYGIPADIEKFNRWTLVPFAFIKSAKERGVIKLNTSGLQYRNFVSLKTVADATTVVGVHDIVNSSGSNSLTIREFALLIQKVIKNKHKHECRVEWSEEQEQESPKLIVESCCKSDEDVGLLANFINDMWMLV